MKKKQKKIMMIVLGVAALGLCALQLGPILMGKPVAPPTKSAKKTDGEAASPAAKAAPKTAAAPAKKGGAPKAARTQTAAKATDSKTAEPTPDQTTAPLQLALDRIDLSMIHPRKFALEWTGLHDPFSAASFELVKAVDGLEISKLKLQGVVQSDNRRIAIISNHSYREGQEVAPGVILLGVDDGGVTLATGDRQVRLSIGGNSHDIKRPMK